MFRAGLMLVTRRY